jgi:hypothetical protein
MGDPTSGVRPLEASNDRPREREILLECGHIARAIAVVCLFLVALEPSEGVELFCCRNDRRNR